MRPKPVIASLRHNKTGNLSLSDGSYDSAPGPVSIISRLVPGTPNRVRDIRLVSEVNATARKSFDRHNYSTSHRNVGRNTPKALFDTGCDDD